MLSAVSMQIQVIQDAIKLRLGKCMLANRDVRIFLSFRKFRLYEKNSLAIIFLIVQILGSCRFKFSDIHYTESGR